MILKVQEENATWVFYDKLERVRVSRNVQREWVKGDCNPTWCEIKKGITAIGVSIKPDEIFFTEDLIERQTINIGGLDGAKTQDIISCTGIFAYRKGRGNEIPVVIVFNTEAYLLSDDGKTIERL